MAFVVAGCPVRDRAWIIERQIDALVENGVDRLFYLANDCEDDTEALIRRSEKARVESIVTRGVKWIRDQDPDATRNLADLRNHWAERAMALWPEATHFWSIDSDTIPAPDVLKRLLAADKPVISAPVRTGRDRWNILGWDFKRQKVTRPKLPEYAIGPIPVSLPAGCYLIRRDVLEAGVRWKHLSLGGEDGGFAQACKARGIQQWLEPQARTEHWISPERSLPSHGPILASGSDLMQSALQA